MSGAICVIDDALNDLGDADREAVLLRFFANLPFAEVGAKLNLSENTARMRVERALDKLHVLLAKRGVTSTSGALAAALAQQAFATAPAGLAASVTGLALSGAAAAGIGTLGALIGFMTGTKTTGVLGVATALTVATALYQSNQARADAVVLAKARNEQTAARARLTELETQARAAEQALADRERAVASIAATNVTPKSPAAASTAEGEAAKQQKALQQFLDLDPQLQTLKLDATRAYYRADYAPLLASIGLSPEQIERYVEARVQERSVELAHRAAGLESPKRKPTAEIIRTLIGDASAERYVQSRKNSDEFAIVNELSVALVHSEAPVTAPQAKRLAEVFARAKTTNDSAVVALARYDWGRILAEAEPVLSPVQLQGLRAQAGLGRMEAQFAAVAREASTTPKK